MKRIIALAACALLAACTTTSTRLATTGVSKPPPAAKVLLVQPDIELSALTFSGMLDARADWSAQGRDNIATTMKSSLEARSHPLTTMDPSTAQEGRVGQLLRLHGAVGQSIMAFNYGVYSLPTKKGAFDWTLGDGAVALGQAYGADYALFTWARGSYSTGGRVVAAALFGVPMGGQQMFSSLVDLKTGQVVWFNVAQAAPGADMRTPQGAASLVQSVLKDAPL